MGKEPPSLITMLGVTWDTGRPMARLRDPAGCESVLTPLVGIELNFRVERNAGRLCIARPAGADCGRPPQSGQRRCKQCSITETMRAADLHHAHKKVRDTIALDVAEHLAQPNVLYVAGFRDGSIKIGTSTEGRTETRLAEQGAWRAVIVARTSDGYAVRDIEDQVTNELGIPQAVLIDRKLAGVVSPVANDQLERTIAEAADRVDELRTALGDDRIQAHRVQWSNGIVDDALWSGLHRYPARVDAGQHDIEVLAASGRIAVVTPRRGEPDRFAVDIGQLYGLQLTRGDFESVELAVQQSLF